MIDGRYRIEHVLGRGGFAITYLASDPDARHVVVKELAPPGCVRSGHAIVACSAADDETLQSSRAQTLQEAETLKGFKDQRIVKVFDFFNANETVYVVMEYLHGSDLGEHARASGGSLTSREVSHILGEILLGLAKVHEQRILHRDLKPSNVMVTSDGRIVLIDFGSARAHDPSTLTTALQAMTPRYAALEQIFGGPKTWATDLFAVGGIGWRLLKGEPPPTAFERHNGASLGTLPANADRDLVETIKWALKLHAGARPQSAEDMLAGLHGQRPARTWVFTGGPRRTPRPGPGGRNVRREPRRRQPRSHRRRSRRQRASEPSAEALRLASSARWPIATLVAAPALVMPLPTAMICLAFVLGHALMLGARATVRHLRSASPLTAAGAVFVLPRTALWALGRVLAWSGSRLPSVFRAALYAVIGAAAAAACAAAGSILQNGHLDQAAFMGLFEAMLPRAAVTASIFLATFRLADGARVKGLVMRATKAAEASVVGLWACGLVIPLLLALTAPLRPWAPFRDPGQVMSWIEDLFPEIRSLDNALGKLWVEQEVRSVLLCGALSEHYGLHVNEIGTRSFTVTVDLDRTRVEHDAARSESTAGGTNAGWQVTLLAAVLGGLDHALSARVRSITVREGSLTMSSSGGLQVQDVVLSLHLPRPHGQVLNDGASVRAAVRAARIPIADPIRGEALEQALPDARGRAASALCG
jgi:predicted Ser/Thr protein kinase